MKNQINRPMITIAMFEFYENIRNKWLLVYSFSFLLFSGLITYFGASHPLKASASLLNLVLLLVPLFSLVFGSLSFSESLSFHQILAALPLSRRDIFLGKLIGLGGGLSLGFLVGMGIGSLLQMNVSQRGFDDYALLMLIGVGLTFIFLGLSFCIVNWAKKKELVFGWVLLVWFFFFVLYDALVMGLVLLFGDYPLEVPIFVLITSNPLDLARILLLLKMDLSSMMGYSGALFQRTFGGNGGLLVASLLFLVWSLVPSWIGLSLFKKKDL